MDREEILKRSRDENKEEDERELAIKVKAGNAAFITGAILCYILYKVTYRVSNYHSVAIPLIMTGMMLPMTLIPAIKLKKRKDWIMSIIYAILFIALLIQWNKELTAL